MKNVGKVLEFERVLLEIAKYAFTSSIKQRIMDLEMMQDEVRIKEELDNTDEALRIVYRYGRCPIDLIHEIKEPVTRASKGATLTIEELYHVASQVDGINKVIDFNNFVKEENIENFRYLVSFLVPVIELKKEVDRCISPNLTIYDHASSLLAKIRKDISIKEKEVRSKIDNYVRHNADKLSDSIVTMRNDRLVIPVKSTFKYDFGGIIHDQSDSGQTFYVEPEAIVSLNSELQLLRHRESEEIERILTELTNIVRANAETLIQNFEYLCELDFLFAKAMYGKEINGKVATLSSKQEIRLKKARHPLIAKDKVVANDFFIGGENKKEILITGPNTGGKTIALKTVGLLVMMNQAGLVIPVDFEATLGVFDNIYVDIGDEQSIEQSLSTFSSHLSKIINITDSVTDKSLVLVDELGGGTDPSEGEALAMSILDYFNEKSCLVLATTHYSNLKSFAIATGYIANASMLFDEEKLQPTYKLVYGIPGKSYAFLISKRLGLNNAIIEKGLSYQNHYQSESDILISKLQVELEKNNKHEEELNNKEKEMNDKIANIDLELQKVKKEKEELVIKSHEKIDELVEDATKEINNIINEMKIRPSSEVKLHEWIEAKKRLEDVSIFEIDEEKERIFNYEVGEDVFIPKLNKLGKIDRKKGDNYFVNIGKVTMELHAKDLAKHTPIKNEAKVSFTAKAKETAVSMECNLIGMYVAEALPVLEKYLDDAILMHYPQVRIVHGCGSGKLRSAVHKYLDKQKIVKSYRLGGAGEGGVGATVVYFK